MTSAKRPLPSTAAASLPAVPRPPDLALRLAQRAFAAALETRSPIAGEADLRTAARRRAARRALSVLSADDRPRLLRWLALQVASMRSVEPLARIDRGLAERVEPLRRAVLAEAAAVTSGTSATRPASPLFGLPAAG
ncbi:MAG: hypothetical protein J0H15_08685 [Xanthomonadales bacterium]|nr:hypothetical protein [Xanthomonadales bacterium]